MVREGNDAVHTAGGEAVVSHQGQVEIAARLERERQFHDERFGEDARHEDSFYWILGDIFDRYRDAVAARSVGRDVLELGSGTASKAVELAGTARSYLGIDISPVAVEQCREAVAAMGVQARFEVMDAEALDVADQSLDLVFGAGIIHHLDTRRAVRELGRVLRPGGQAVFLEPLGSNPVINRYRDRTPDARTPDEHPLVEADFRIFRTGGGGGVPFSLQVETAGLATLAAVPLGGRRGAPTALRATSVIDRTLTRVPRVRNLAWMSLIIATRG